jgi:hypothetical protein
VSSPFCFTSLGKKSGSKVPQPCPANTIKERDSDISPVTPIPADKRLRVSQSAITLTIRVNERNAIYRQVLPQATIFRVTKERWAQIGVTIEFLIVVRTLGEFFRLRHVHGTNFSTAVAALYVGGALIAACSCWAGVTLYFFRRYMLSAWITLATVPVLLVYKVAVIGR